jgi:hopanoid-associated phosphorylase
VSRPGILTGLESEAAIVRKHAPYGFDRDLIACAGPGSEAAHRAALSLIDKGVGGLISFGYAGGIARGIAAGDLIIASEIRHGRDDVQPCEPIWSDALASALSAHARIHRAPIAASSEIVKSTQDKMTLRYITGAFATDMESFAIAQVAADAGLPFVTLRVVIDTHDQDLPPMAVEAAGPDGRLKPWRILWSLISNPGQIPKLGPLTRNSRLADRTLIQVCREAGEIFALPDYRAGLVRQIGAV